jgi:hypothetical protein
LPALSPTNILIECILKGNISIKSNKFSGFFQIQLSIRLLAGFNPTPFKSQNAFFPALLSIFAPHLKTRI